MRFTLYFGYILAAILLVILIYILVKQVREYHERNDPMLITLKEILLPVHPIVKSLKLYKGSKSYTINKKKVFLCLYDKNGKYYPLNMLIYVLLHEMAHILNDKDVGHTENFYTEFDKLLKKAESMGIYNSNIPAVKDYCGHT